MRRHPTLRDAAVFRGLDTPVVADLTDQLPRVYFRAGQLIFATGEPGDRLYLVLEGKVKIGRRACDGREGLLLIVGSTDVDTAIITLGGLDPKAISASLAALALAGTVLVNMTVKLGLTLAYARSRGYSAALALGASMIALVVMIAIASLRVW